MVRFRFLPRLLFLAFVYPAICSLAWGQEADRIDFRREIQPLLARDCYACHGPDDQAREAGLRLDVEAEAKGHAIVEGEPDSSELIERIFSEDPDVQMPPPETGHSLSTAEKERLRRWIQQGAPWAKHWAFESIDRPDVPVLDSDWPANSIDSFVLCQLRQRDLQPSPPANKSVLLRRLYLDLIGIPPTPEQRQAYLNDRSDDAYEKVVDQLLASPHFGEHQAAHWLDAARYADTNGYQNDFIRNMWPWRDWVIQAFNQNLPYDEFIVQQLAGDLLPQPTQAQLIATGFNRNNRSVTEGGSIEEEWRIENCVDRVETTAGAFLGLTMGCARCHDHKYDPISQREFYQFFAFFNNVDEKGFYNEARGNVGPQVKVSAPETQAKLNLLTEQIKSAEQRLESSQRTPEQIHQQLKTWREADEGEDSLPVPVYALNVVPEGSPEPQVLEFTGQADSSVSADAGVPGDLNLKADAAWSWTAWVRGNSRGALMARMDESNSFRGFDALILGDGRLKVHLIHNWNANAIAVNSSVAIPEDGWTLITVTYDGSRSASGLKFFFDGQTVATQPEVDSLKGSIDTAVPFKLGQRNTTEYLKGAIADFRVFDRALTEAQVVVLVRQMVATRYATVANDPPDEQAERALGVAEMEKLAQQIISAEPIQQLATLKAEYQKVESTQPTTMVMRDRKGYRETFLLRRGQYDQPDKELGPLFPAIPAVLPALTESQPKNRLGLARWMVDERNPLVGRVAVNRAWMQLFGRGLVYPPDNFGVQGSPPSHPELLDWLADEFRRSGWDWKQLHKTMVMSATYRQSSDGTVEGRAADPENEWLSRGPRYRMSAEQIRDQALAVAGLLTADVGGPSVFPYQPDGLWEELAGGASNGPYKQSTGSDLYRRSLYTYRKRTVSHPTLATLDAPTWEICQLYRSETNTPLQALALLNDPTYVEAARMLAQRMIAEAETDSDAAAIRRGFLLTHLRPPTEDEMATLQAGFAEYYRYYQTHANDAAELVQVGESETNSQLPLDRLAALTSVALVLLNRDEVISKH